MHLLTTHCCTHSNTFCFVTCKVGAFCPISRFAYPEFMITPGLRCIGFERCHVFDRSPGSHVCCTTSLLIMSHKLIHAINSNTPDAHECNIYWDGGPDKIESFRTQHTPMCSSNWVCARLRLEDAIVKEDGGTPSPKRMMYRHSVDFLVN
jgi:hypothetical protein